MFCRVYFGESQRYNLNCFRNSILIFQIKETISIDDFSISQTSLDDVFVSFASESEENGSVENFKEDIPDVHLSSNGTQLNANSV